MARRRATKGAKDGSVCMDMAFGTCRTCGKVLARLVRRRGRGTSSRKGAGARMSWYCSDRCMEAKAGAGRSAVSADKGAKAGPKAPARAKKRKTTRMTRKNRQ